MSSSRKYKCIFCSKSFERTALSTHITRKHSEMICSDKGYTANRIVFDTCNKKEPIGAGHGNCRICKNPTLWNEKTIRYEAYCSDRCREQARKEYERNMLRVYGKTTLLDDPVWQEKKMLSNRGISGKYKWSDGTYKSYVGSYEKKFLEFCDNVLELDSNDLITPGPTINYEYKGEKHTWITDALYIPYNLVFDIKDGGNNKNNREMPDYRAKQLMKEKFITDQGEYNYIRLTNNEFVQLLTIFAELKEMYMDSDDPDTISRIHEHMGPGLAGGMPSIPGDDMSPNKLFITNYMNKNTSESGFAVSDDIESEYVITRDKNSGKLKKRKSKEVFKDAKKKTYEYTGENVKYILRDMYNKYIKETYVGYYYLPCVLTEFTDILSDDQLDFSEQLQYVDMDLINEKFISEIATIQYNTNMDLRKQPVFEVLDPIKYEYKKKLLYEYGNLNIVQSMNGKYFAYNKLSRKRTRGVNSIYEITDTMLKSIKGGNNNEIQ